MNSSSEINHLAAALSLLQGEINDIPKTKDVKTKDGKKAFSHAELSGVLDIARPLLTKNGLAVTQLPSVANKLNDKPNMMSVNLETVLMHKSGQWISSSIEMTVDTEKFYMNDPQKVGALITYARRYGLVAILGITQVDDEESLMQAKTSSNRTSYAPKESSVFIETIQVENLKKLINGDVPTSNFIRNKYSINRLEELTQTQYTQIVDSLRVMKSSQEEPIKQSLVV